MSQRPPAALKQTKSHNTVATMKTTTTEEVKPKVPSTTADAKARKVAKKTAKRTFKQTENSIGLLVTAELDSAIARCKARVENIAATSRARNEKFRDEDFDLKRQREACLWGLEAPDDAIGYSPPDVMRVGDIFEKPVFFEDGVSSSDIKQGGLGDCWFLSGLAVVATVPGLLEKICVARDEPVGVYGFIFFRDSRWVDVIIDDQLFVNAVSYEHLSPDQKQLYHNNADLYESIGRKGSNILYYARSSVPNETWVPLIEKAYAKHCGNYSYLSGGFPMHAIEDLTGGVCRQSLLSDVLDKDRLWSQFCEIEDHGKLYACEFINAPYWIGQSSQTLVQGHAYSVLRAGEYNGKRFVIVRNPWGFFEWNGRWSDGSKEWTAEWLPALPALGHTFGQDGQFIMEYSDFLSQFERIDITRLFDSTWVSSYIWVQLPGMEEGQLSTWGDVSFTISVPDRTETVIALQQVDSSSFKEISGFLNYDLEFVVFKKGSAQQVAASQSYLKWWARSQSTEVELDAGEYVMHVRISGQPRRDKDYIKDGLETSEDKTGWNKEAYHKLKARQTEAYSKALNYSDEVSEAHVPVPLDSLAGYDLTELEMKNFETKRGEVERKKTLLEARKAEVKATGKKSDAAPLVKGGGEANKTSSPASIQVNNPIETPAVENPPANNTSGANTTDASKTEEMKVDSTATVKESKAVDPATSTTEAASAEAKPAEPPKPAVHEFKKCNECGKSPIIGLLYHCDDKACEDYDLCQTCFDGKKHDQTHIMKVIATPAHTVHTGVTCSTCAKTPVIGILYKCDKSECKLPFSCHDCYNKTQHSLRHNITIVRWVSQADEEEPPKHVGIMCDYCEDNPIVGTRYKCMHAECATYNLCEKCVHKAIHSAEHKFLSLKTPAEAEYLNPTTLDGSPLVLGLRVYTKKTVKVVLGAQLKHRTLGSRLAEGSDPVHGPEPKAQ